jgi:hypothetical protein
MFGYIRPMMFDPPNARNLSFAIVYIHHVTHLKRMESARPLHNHINQFGQVIWSGAQICVCDHSHIHNTQLRTDL